MNEHHLYALLAALARGDIAPGTWDVESGWEYYNEYYFTRGDSERRYPLYEIAAYLSELERKVAELRKGDKPEASGEGT